MKQMYHNSKIIYASYCVHVTHAYKERMLFFFKIGRKQKNDDDYLSILKNRNCKQRKRDCNLKLITPKRPFSYYNNILLNKIDRIYRNSKN